MPVPISNSHIHTPYSFSCFESVGQAVECAGKERVKVLGISDFNTVEGYGEFAKACADARVHPLYNIEFIALSAEDKQKGLRWNDPKNPGVMYFCGKGLDHPSGFPQDTRNILASLWKGTQDHIWRVIEKTNGYCREVGVELALDYGEIRSSYAKLTVRERHVAKAIYHAFETQWADTSERMTRYRRLFADQGFSGDLSDDVAMQNDIRNRLLKAGKPAFVEEEAEAFLSLPEVMKTILAGGGIPCYPVLIDDRAGLTEHEANAQQLAGDLKEKGVHVVEFIPLRNTLDHLKHYAMHFHENGFFVVFGTEHNTPQFYSMVPSARDGVALDPDLLHIGYRGACAVAAHQKCHSLGQPGFVNGRGERIVNEKAIEGFVRLGDAAIRESIGLS